MCCLETLLSLSTVGQSRCWTGLGCGGQSGGGACVVEKRKCRMRRIFLGRLEDTVDHRNSGKGGTRSW